MLLSKTLFSIIAHARSGAVDYAWQLLLDAGLDRIKDDPAVLCVVGRLLKDRALASTGEKRQRLYLDAAAAYSRAGDINGATYPLINAATLSLLAGHREQAKGLARKILQLCKKGKDEAETPYYRAATEAEAQLLVGDIAQAKAKLAEAVAKAPRAFEDHASTLRQFGLILDELGEDSGWLDAFRPPRCLYYAGHMDVSANDQTVIEQIRSAIREERIGFGFGALAAGADILAAEALIAENAELHLVLPAAPDLFRQQSVACLGSEWGTRFDFLIEAAESVRIVEPNTSSPPVLKLAAEIAMGRAVMQAKTLMTEAVQFVVLDSAPKGEAGTSQWIASTWKASGRRQRIFHAPRVDAHRTSQPRQAAAEERLLASLRITWSGADSGSPRRDVLSRLADSFAEGTKPCVSPRWIGDSVLAGFDNPVDAARAALKAVTILSGAAGIRVAGHYGVVSTFDDPFGGPPILSGDTVFLTQQMMASISPGAVHITEDFAAALHARAQEQPRTEYIGELPDELNPVRLFALT